MALLSLLAALSIGSTPYGTSDQPAIMDDAPLEYGASLCAYLDAPKDQDVWDAIAPGYRLASTRLPPRPLGVSRWSLALSTTFGLWSPRMTTSNVSSGTVRTAEMGGFQNTNVRCTNRALLAQNAGDSSNVWVLETLITNGGGWEPATSAICPMTEDPTRCVGNLLLRAGCNVQVMPEVVASIANISNVPLLNLTISGRGCVRFHSSLGQSKPRRVHFLTYWDAWLYTDTDPSDVKLLRDMRELRTYVQLALTALIALFVLLTSAYHRRVRRGSVRKLLHDAIDETVARPLDLCSKHTQWRARALRHMGVLIWWAGLVMGMLCMWTGPLTCMLSSDLRSLSELRPHKLRRAHSRLRKLAYLLLLNALFPLFI